MMIGGQDIEIETRHSVGESLYRAVQSILEIWPEGVIQDSNSSDLLKPEDLLSGSLSEVFVFRDKPNLDSWDKDGWTELNCKSMISIIMYDDGTFTCVLEDANDAELGRILDGIRYSVLQAD